MGFKAIQKRFCYVPWALKPYKNVRRQDVNSKRIDTNHSRERNAILNCLRLTALRFCMCHGFKAKGTFRFTHMDSRSAIGSVRTCLSRAITVGTAQFSSACSFAYRFAGYFSRPDRHSAEVFSSAFSRSSINVL